MKLKTAPRQSEPDTTGWLDGLPPAAQWQGRAMLERNLITNRARFREYLVAFAELDALPRTSATPLDTLSEAFAHAANLLHASPKWWHPR